MLYRFVSELHQDAGELGFRMIGREDFDPSLTGMGIAHDIIEHHPDDNKSLWGELEAIGSMVYTRHEGGILYERGLYRTIDEVFGMSLFEVLEYMRGEQGYDGNYGNYSLIVPDKYRPILQMPPKKLRYESAEDVVSSSIDWLSSKGLEMMMGEHHSHDDLEGEELEEFKQDLTQDINLLCGYAQVAVREGYRKIKRRFRGLDGWDVAYTIFKQIEKKCDPLFKEIQTQELEGVELHVSLITRRRLVECKLVDRRDW